MYISIKLMIVICADNCGVIANKHILVMFFVVSSPFPFTTGSPVGPNSSEKTNRGFIEAKHTSRHSSPYNRPTGGITVWL